MENLTKTHIDKSLIAGLKFSKDDVLNTQEEKSIRNWKLNRALQVGNNYKTHVNLVFQDLEKQVYSTELTVWAVTDNQVVLKGTMMVPISSVIDIEGV
jgi:hypothetical protein